MLASSSAGVDSPLGRWSYQAVVNGSVGCWTPLKLDSVLVPALEESLRHCPQIGLRVPWPTVCKDRKLRTIPKLFLFVGKTSQTLEYQADGAVLIFRKHLQFVSAAALAPNTTIGFDVFPVAVRGR